MVDKAAEESNIAKHIVHLKDLLDDLERHKPHFVNHFRALLNLLIIIAANELERCEAEVEDAKADDATVKDAKPTDLEYDEAYVDPDIEMTDVCWEPEDELELLVDGFTGGINNESTEE